ncbi:MAG: CHC2 zinc finger domain-containing protein, partial [Melioribacteraceae bacterium]
MYTGINFAKEIKARYNILDLCNDIGLKPNSSNFVLSIYKQEKTPSLKLYLKTNSYKCFATGNGGDLIKFYCDYYKIEVKQGIKELAEKLNISNDQTNNEKSAASFKTILPVKFEVLKSEREFFNERTEIIIYNNDVGIDEAEQISFADVLEQRKLKQTKVFEGLYQFCNKDGLDGLIFDYLISNKRGLNEETIKRFRLFSVQSVKQTIEFLKDSFTREEVTLSGLFKNKFFLFTKHRLVIPFIENDKITYLRARYFYKGIYQTDKFKYTSVNNWSKTLSPKRFFNSDLLKGIKPFDNLIITEGEFDCMVASKHGSNAIGVAGTGNFPKDKIQLLNQFNIYLAFDDDEAGKK